MSAFKLREYQKEALEHALKYNDSVCVLPTGTGKTLIGIAWVVELLSRGLTKKVLILEPSRFLVEQTCEMYKNKTTIPAEKIDIIYGIESPEKRKEKWKDGGKIIIVSTPHTAFNDKKFINSFDAVVIDECHRTVGEYAYVKLLREIFFKYRLGLTATLTNKVRPEVKKYLSSNIKQWTWQELREKYPQYKFPAWLGEIYDAELSDEEEKFLLRTEQALGGGGFCLRTFTRDGAIALKETVNKPTTKLYKELPQELKDKLRELRELHKLDTVKTVLNEHDFEKAIIFVDRVCVANKLKEIFKDLNPVCFIGRLRLGLEGQKEALQKAKKPEHRLIISTSAGEEGVDLPSADLLIIWSNVASPIRFIQRHGRITRPSDKLKIVVFVATPRTESVHSPDYDSLYTGLVYAKENGIDIIELDDGTIKILKTKTSMNRICTLLDGEPLSFEEIRESLGRKEKGKTRVKEWLDSCLKEKDDNFRVLYFYRFPYDEIRNKVNEQIELYKSKCSYTKRQKEGFYRFAINRIMKLEVKDRYYFLFSNLEHVEEEFAQYFLLPDKLGKFNISFKIESNSKKIVLSEWILSALHNKFTLYQNHSLKCSTMLNYKIKINIKFEEDIDAGYLGTILTTPLHESTFEEVVRYIKRETESKYIGLNFSSQGKSCFFSNLIYTGIFDEKALRLVFYNVFYIVNSIKDFLKKSMKNN